MIPSVSFDAKVIYQKYVVSICGQICRSYYLAAGSHNFLETLKITPEKSLWIKQLDCSNSLNELITISSFLQG
jgi:hypothetical protein